MFFRRLHASWFIGWSSLGVILGIGICAGVGGRAFISWSWPVSAVALLGICFLKRFKWMVLLALIAGCLIGLWRGSSQKAELDAYLPYYGHEVVLKGRVAQDASHGAKGDQRLNLSNVTIDDKPLAGEVWVSAPKADIKRGDLITIKGKLDEGFGSLSASMYRVQILQLERPNPGDVARRIRDWFGNGVRSGIPDPQVNLGLGYLVGQKTALPPDLEEQIRITGLTHVVVASGYNLTILVVFARRVFAKISKYFAALASSLMILSFMMVTGFSPSMSRAGLVAGLGLLVWYYGRKMHPFVLLSFAAGITGLVNPSYVWGDLGWYLSFTAFIGVIVLAPLVQHYFWGLSRNTPLLRQLLVDTSCAQIVTMPVILLAFEKYSSYALPANMLVLPFVPMAMLLTFLAGIFGLLLPGLAQFFAFPATVILTYSVEVIKSFANLPGAQGDFSFNPNLMVLSYIGIGATIFYLKWRTKHDFRSEMGNDSY